MTYERKALMLETAIARLKAGDSREQIRADFIVFIDSVLNEAVIEEARRHNAALPPPDLPGYSPGPVNFDASITTITCKDGEWSAEPADVEFLDYDRHMLPVPGSKVIHSRGGIVTSELLPDTWEGVKEWQANRRKQMESNHAE